MGTLSEDLLAVKEVEDTLVANKVARFAYTDTAYADNDADGVDEYDYENEQNIPNPTTAILKVNSTVLDKGYRAQASSITRMLINHFFGRVSYNLNKINDNMSALIATLRSHAGTANGFATLDSNGRIPYSQLPESAVELKGYWNAQTNTPTLADGIGDNGDEYFVDVAGSQDLGSGEQYFKVGDRVVYTGGMWKNIDSGTIRTINGETPNYQGERSVELGNNLPVTRGLLGALFSTLLLKVFKTTTIDRLEVDRIAYVNGLWFSGHSANSANSVISLVWSEDLEHWNLATGGVPIYTVIDNKISRINNKIPCITYGNGVYVCSTSEGMWWSEDGKAWSKGTGNNGSITMNMVVYANGLFVSASDEGMWWSEDGKAWSKGTGNNATIVNGCLLYENNIFVCTSEQGVWWSEDGKAWTQSDYTSYDIRYTPLMYAGEVFFLPYVKSSDGKTWAQLNTPAGSSKLSEIKYANGLWIGFFNQVLAWSDNGGDNWTSVQLVSTLAYQGLNCVVHGDKWVLILFDETPSVDKSKIYWSEDGKNWTLATIPNVNGTIFNTTYANGVWVAGDAVGDILYSLDGKTWSAITSFIPYGNIASVQYKNGSWCLGDFSTGKVIYARVDDLISEGLIDLGGAIPLVNVRELL